jgi:predicted nuclease with TOPRIM domain
MCKAIGDMANENKRLQERITQLEESLESANTFLQLVMCEQNQLRDVRNKANDRIKQLEEAGDALYENSNPSRWDSPEAAARKMIDQSNWNKAKEAK